MSTLVRNLKKSDYKITPVAVEDLKVGDLLYCDPIRGSQFGCVRIESIKKKGGDTIVQYRLHCRVLASQSKIVNGKYWPVFEYEYLATSYIHENSYTLFGDMWGKWQWMGDTNAHPATRIFCK